MVFDNAFFPRPFIRFHEKKKWAQKTPLRTAQSITVFEHIFNTPSPTYLCNDFYDPPGASPFPFKAHRCLTSFFGSLTSSSHIQCNHSHILMSIYFILLICLLLVPHYISNTSCLPNIFIPILHVQKNKTMHAHPIHTSPTLPRIDPSPMLILTPRNTLPLRSLSKLTKTIS